MKRSGYLGLAFLIVLLLAVPVLGQQAKSKAEYDAYMAFYNEQNPQKKAELGEKFLTDYKETDFKQPAFQLLVDAYVRAQNWATVMDAAGRFEQAVPNADARSKGSIYLNAMAAANQTNNFEKTIEYGDRVLAIDPNNLNAQLTLSQIIPERLPEGEAAKSQALNKAYDLATKAHGQVQKIFSQPKPAQFTEEQWNRERANIEGTLLGTLGMIHLNRAEYGKSVEQYLAAIKMSPKTWVNYFRLGLAYRSQAPEVIKQLDAAVKAENEAKAAKAEKAVVDELVAKREALEKEAIAKQDQAIDALAKAVAIGGAEAKPARDQLERLYKAKNNDSLEGLEELINKKKGEIPG